MKELSIEDRIDFDLINLKKGERLETSGNIIVTVVAGKIKSKLRGILDKFESTVYHYGDVVAEENSLLTIFDVKELKIIYDEINVDKDFGEYCRENWSQLRELYDFEGLEKVDLYRGNQIEKEFNGKQYKFNLWFCGSKVDCLFHNQHNFIEIHTSIVGKGFMQKSLTEKNDGTDQIIETVGLMPGSSHKPFNIEGEFENNGNPKYPFHRWLGGETGNIWLAIEEY